MPTTDKSKNVLYATASRAKRLSKLSDEELKAIKDKRNERDRLKRIEKKNEKAVEKNNEYYMNELKQQQKQLEKKRSIEVLTNAIKAKKARNELEQLKQAKRIDNMKTNLINDNINPTSNIKDIKKCIDDCFKCPKCPKQPKPNKPAKPDKPIKSAKPDKPVNNISKHHKKFEGLNEEQAKALREEINRKNREKYAKKKEALKQQQ